MNSSKSITKFSGVCRLFTLMIGLILIIGCSPAQVQFAPPSPETAQTATPTHRSGTSIPSPIPPLMANLSPISTVQPKPMLIRHGDRARPYLALTFDACQHPNQPAGYDAAIISILTQTRTPATLFLGGLWMQRHPAQTRALAANPLFELGNHSWSHADFAHLTPEEMSAEILRTQQLMVTLTGRPATLFRFPYGSHTEEALAVVGQQGLQAIQWDVLTGDPDPAVSARAMVSEVTAQAQNGSIVIMHMNDGGRHTAEALPAIIEQLRAQGYTFVTVSQLLDWAGPPDSPRSPLANGVSHLIKIDRS
jgi:peptidoglycan/xylan/chitin deacetylase (PgdA/CDA1 family)